eukprot:TRINITY_DN33536_c0_g1_i1.p1 TRINITY_DN33536_c0_g1~~TRINITY_DN33536_c0_g1_i1.p1  ORF type:complete len:123 (+),score=13.53 TRINITY_DN33536_c0_g1_i1:134-502(+)
MVQKRKKFSGNVPWRAAPTLDLPRLCDLPSRRLRRTPFVTYALSVVKDPDPIGNGLASCAFIESAGRECLIPGYVRPVRLLGLQIWPIDFSKFTRPVSNEVETIGMIVESAFELIEIGSGYR